LQLEEETETGKSEITCVVSIINPTTKYLTFYRDYVIKMDVI